MGLTTILVLDAVSCTRPGLYGLRAGASPFPARGKDRVRLRCLALAHLLAELGTGSGAGAVRHPSAPTGWAAWDCLCTPGARRLRPPDRQLPAIAGVGHGNVVPLS